MYFSVNTSYKKKMQIEKLQKVWPEWKVEKQIGKGSFGTVYQAIRDENGVESKAAIKVISIPLDSSEADTLRSEGLDEEASKTYFRGVVDDFVNEIRMMESFKGIQNIVSVEDYKVVEKEEEIGWDIYIRMELLTPFQTYIQDKKLTEENVIQLGCDICTALEICGQRNIIHRDIKPENIFVNNFGHFKLGDFGIARKMEHVTTGLSQKGTQNYMAPEVFTGGYYDARVDIYSLGVVLYRLMNSNRMPFIDSEQQLMNPNARRAALERRIQGEALAAPCEATPEMANVILRACAFNPEDRFANVTEMKNALLAVKAGNYTQVVLGSNSGSEDDMDKTQAVHRAPDQKIETSSADLPKNTFGQKKSKLPFVIGAVILIALLGIGILWVSTRDKKTSNTGDNVSPTPTEMRAPTNSPIPEPIGLISMPNVLGYTLEDAENLLSVASKELSVEVVDEVYSSEPKGTIISQYPVAASDILANGTVKLTLSRGPEPTEVPEMSPTPTIMPTPIPATPTPTNKPTSVPATPTPTVTPTNTPTPKPVHKHSYNEEYKCTSCGYVYYTEGLAYKLHDLGTYYIVTGIGSAKGAELIIPSEYNGIPVKELQLVHLKIKA